MPQLWLEQEPQQHLGLESVQGIQLLNMTSLELGEHLRDQALSNPFLTLSESECSKHSRSDLRSQHVSAERLIERTRPQNPSFAAATTSGSSYGEVRREFPFEKHLISKSTLREYLSEQAGVVVVQGEEHIFEEFIGNIDGHGYLRISTAEVAQACQVPEKQVIASLKRLQQALPAGIGARNVAECLLLQLAAKGTASALATRVITRHLEALSRGQIKQIAEACSASTAQVQEVYEEIRKLNPRPASQFSCESEPCIWPELELYCDEEGCFSVRHVESLLPELRIDETYLSLLENAEIGTKAKNYLKENLRLAYGLFDALEQRKKTMLDIAGAIMYCQQDFCCGGLSSLVPLTMAQVASLAKVHESTVSRVVNDTYMQTPHGLIELRSFFSPGFVSDTGDACSVISIKEHIINLVSKEDKKRPLSDQQIAKEIASTMGVTVSRRTINKYRKSLGVLNHTQRRTY